MSKHNLYFCDQCRENDPDTFDLTRTHTRCSICKKRRKSVLWLGGKKSYRNPARVQLSHDIEEKSVPGTMAYLLAGIISRHIDKAREANRWAVAAKRGGDDAYYYRHLSVRQTEMNHARYMINLLTDREVR